MSNEEKIIAILEEHSKRFDQIDKRFDDQEAKFNKRFDKQEAKLSNHDEDIKSIKNSLINIEIQVTEKIPALFDAFTSNMDKHKIYDEHIASLNAKTFNHTIRIEALEDNFKNLSVSA